MQGLFLPTFENGSVMISSHLTLHKLSFYLINNELQMYMEVLTAGPLFRSMELMLTSMRNMVTSKAILPGTMSMGIRKLMKDAMVSNAVGR